MGEVLKVVPQEDGTDLLVPMTAEERIEHRLTNCPECKFVEYKADILVNHVDSSWRENCRITFRDWLLAKIGLASLENKIISLGKFTMPGWAGHAIFYLFDCPVCDHVAVDYGHGYEVHINCNFCDTRYDLESPRFYVDSGLPPKPGFWEQVKQINEIRRRIKAENKKRPKRLK